MAATFRIYSGALRRFVLRTRVRASLLQPTAAADVAGTLVIPGDRFRQGTGLDRRALTINRPDVTTSKLQLIRFKECSLAGTRPCAYYTLSMPSQSWPTQSHSKTAARLDSSMASDRSLGGTETQNERAAAASTKVDFCCLSSCFPEASLWYVLTAITLTAVGRQHLISDLWEQLATRAVHHEASRGSSGVGCIESLKRTGIRLREGLMKMSVLLGYPRAINALSTLYEVQQQLSRLETPSAVVHAAVFTSLSEAPPTRPYLISDQGGVNGSTSDQNSANGSTSNNYSRGLTLFTQLYSTKHVPTLMHNLSVSSAGDLANFAISRLYGDLLSDVSILDKRETGLACFATCLAMALGAGPLEQDLAKQIKGHMYGARNLGASGDEIRGTIALVIKIWECVTGEHFRNAADSVKLILEKAKGW